MEFKTLNNKLKEIYFNPQILNDSDDLTNENNKIWNNMNIIASQNLAFLQIKFA